MKISKEVDKEFMKRKNLDQFYSQQAEKLNFVDVRQGKLFHKEKNCITQPILNKCSNNVQFNFKLHIY